MKINTTTLIFSYGFLLSIIFIAIFIPSFTNNKKTTEGMTHADAFCEEHREKGHLLEENCSKLTQDMCTTTSCCVWTSNNKCVAGNQKGALFNSDEKGKTQILDYYYYKDKCYGAKC